MAYFSFLDERSIAEDITALRPGLYQHLGPLAVAIMTTPSAFSMGEKELMGAYVSALNECSFCVGAHLATAAAHGVDVAILADLLENIGTAQIGDHMRPVYAFLKKLTLTPSQMVQADAEIVYKAGWSEGDLEIVIAVCALFSFANRMVDGYGINRYHNQATFDAIGKRFAAGSSTLPNPPNEDQQDSTG